MGPQTSAALCGNTKEAMNFSCSPWEHIVLQHIQVSFTLAGAVVEEAGLISSGKCNAAPELRWGCSKNVDCL
jgi:hypothetical protein